MKPEITHELKTGRALGAQRGFATTFNWMLNFCRNLTGGPGVTVDRTDTDHPIIRLSKESSSAILPFTCRFHKTEDDETGKFEIYLPNGCVAVGEECAAINRHAKEVDGHEDDADCWRLICFVDNSTYWNQYAKPRTYAEAYTDQNGEEHSRNVTRYEWGIYVHAKTSAKEYNVDRLEWDARRLFYVSARPLDISNNASVESQADLDARYWNKNKAGDEFSVCVGKIIVERRVIGSKIVTTSKYEHYRRTSIAMTARDRTGFGLVWYFSVHDDGYLKTEKVYCVKQSLSAAGITIQGPEMSDVTNAAESIYAKIKTNPLNPDANSGTVEVVCDPQDMSTDDDLTWLQLYSITDNCVSYDWRAQSLANVQVYR